MAAMVDRNIPHSNGNLGYPPIVDIVDWFTKKARQKNAETASKLHENEVACQLNPKLNEISVVGSVLFSLLRCLNVVNVFGDKLPQTIHPPRRLIDSGRPKLDY